MSPMISLPHSSGFMVSRNMETDRSHTLTGKGKSTLSHATLSTQLRRTASFVRNLNGPQDLPPRYRGTLRPPSRVVLATNCGRGTERQEELGGYKYALLAIKLQLADNIDCRMTMWRQLCVGLILHCLTRVYCGTGFKGAAPLK